MYKNILRFNLIFGDWQKSSKTIMPLAPKRILSELVKYSVCVCKKINLIHQLKLKIKNTYKKLYTCLNNEICKTCTYMSCSSK